jgi:hypothetical protein
LLVKKKVKDNIIDQCFCFFYFLKIPAKQWQTNKNGMKKKENERLETMNQKIDVKIKF